MGNTQDRPKAQYMYLQNFSNSNNTGDYCLGITVVTNGRKTRPPRERQIQRSIPAFAVGIFPGRVMPVTSKLALQRILYQAPGVTRLALGLVGPLSVYCD